MRVGASSILVLILTGCGGGGHSAAPTRTPLATVEVPKEQAEPDPGGETTPPDRGSNSGGDAFAGCVVKLRDARDVPAPESERRFYDEGRAAENRNDLSSARKDYFELVQKFPSSKLIPLAYLAFAELFAAEAASDPSKWELARQAYQEVIKYPPPDNVAYPYGLLRLGDTRRQSDGAEALQHYTRALDATRQYPSLPCAEAIRIEARQRLVDAFAEVGAPEKAYVFFKAKEDQNEALEMMERLVERYRRAEHPAEACSAIRGIPQQLDSSRAARLRAQSNELCARH